MKSRKMLMKLGSALVLLIMAVVIIIATPAMAVIRYSPHYISIAPDHGPVGTEVRVYGSSFTPGTTTIAKIYFPDKNTLVKSINIDLQGNFETSFIVSQVPAGEYTVWAFDESASLSSWDGGWRIAKFKVEPSIDLSKSSGFVGDNITANGAGFAANSNVSIYFDDLEVSTAITDQNGSFTRSVVIIPESENGSYTLKAVDTDSNQSIAAFAVQQEVIIGQSSGPADENVMVSGTGFTANKSIIIALGEKVVVTNPPSVKTNHNGSFTAKFLVPNYTADNYTMGISDGSNKAGASFVIEPSGSINRIIGYVGSEVTFSGTGFVPDRIAIINYDSLQLAETTVDSNGDFSVHFKIPNSSEGEHTVSATDGTNSTEHSFTVLPRTYAPNGSINRIIGYVGSEVTFSGTGFVPDRIAIINYDSLQLAETTVDSGGNFSVKFKVPASSGGMHTISATDGTNTVESAFTMESMAPPAPVPLLPADGSVVDSAVHFVWEGVTDPSGVTYTLQIAFDASFASDNDTSLVLEKSRLNTAEYNLTPMGNLEEIEPGTPYYWRVKAVDNASNIGEWSGVQDFYVRELHVGTSLPAMSGWFLYSLIVEGGVFICFIGYWILRRRRRT
jgi:hypothetical protein